MNQLLLDENQIKELRKQYLHHNVFPIFLPNVHYDSSPRPVAEVLKPLVADCIAFLGTMNEDELTAFVQTIPPGFRMRVDDAGQPRTEEYMVRVALYYLAANANRHFFA